MEDRSSFEEVEEPQEDSSDIQITPPKEPEVNPEVYTDTVALVARGFLMGSADINEVPFVFKSLNHHEFEMIRILTGVSAQSVTVPPRFWDLFLAHTVLFVDGQNVLVDRNKHLPKLANTFRELPSTVKARLIRQLSDLNRKASQAALLVEAYATEAFSRWRWAQVHNLDLSSPALTGIDGTDKLGLSYAQLSWRAINHYEDIRSRNDTEWENAKFIGGCFAGKGIDKVYRRDNDRRRKEREERWNRKDQIIRHVLFGDPLETNKKYGGAQVIVVASTVEELASQVEKSLRGEKDWHDEVVQSYENNIRENVQRKQEQIQELAQTHQEQMGGKDLTGQTQLKGLTPDQVQRMIAEQRKREAEALASAGSNLTGPVDEHMKKWGLKDTEVPTTDKSTEGAISLQSRRNASKPWRP